MKNNSNQLLAKISLLLHKAMHFSLVKYINVQSLACLEEKVVKVKEKLKTVNIIKLPVSSFPSRYSKKKKSFATYERDLMKLKNKTSGFNKNMYFMRIRSYVHLHVITTNIYNKSKFTF